VFFFAECTCNRERGSKQGGGKNKCGARMQMLCEQESNEVVECPIAEPLFSVITS